MNFEPQKFFIGLVDFFSIFMPGALVVFIGQSPAVAQIEQSGIDVPSEGAAAVAVFLFASYLAGHFIFLIGAKFLDDFIYDPLRNATTRRQVERLAGGKNLSFRPVRWLADRSIFFGRKPDRAVQLVLLLKSRSFEGTPDPEAINAFQWCKARLSKEHPEGLAAVQRFEADSKFFRSFVVVLAPLAVVFAIQQRFLWAGCAAALVGMSLWRYVEQRFKSTEHAYWHVITLARGNALATRPRPDGLTHAGGVLYREREDGTYQYLMVTAKRDPTEWVLPKGHTKPGEKLEETAVREVHEEADHWACICRNIDDVVFALEEKEINVRFFLMKVLQRSWTVKRPSLRKKRCEPTPSDRDRLRRWMTSSDVDALDVIGARDMQAASKGKVRPETKWIVRLADELLATLPKKA